MVATAVQGHQSRLATTRSATSQGPRRRRGRALRTRPLLDVIYPSPMDRRLSAAATSGASRTAPRATKR
eukprot:8404933-Pyramimonas_sp.AAC.1